MTFPVSCVSTGVKNGEVLFAELDIGIRCVMPLGVGQGPVSLLPWAGWFMITEVPPDFRLTLLQLQQFADTALPIGGAAHSFGLEFLVESGWLDGENLEGFLRDYLQESGEVEACYCAASCQLGQSSQAEETLELWLSWNRDLGARKPARESRDASSAMGRRFLLLAGNVMGEPLLIAACEQSETRALEVHLALCFGLTAGLLRVDPGLAAAVYLQQSMATLLSCCQRLMPLGQTRAQQILWNLKPQILSAAKRGSSTSPSSVESFSFLTDLASALHPGLRTRLFMS